MQCVADHAFLYRPRTVNMSSLSRRACYKCGNVGHYAEVCSSAERLCYNCKQPGHESNQCPLPRTTEAKQCYHCQGLGHVQADCPTLRLSGAGAGRCYNCGQPGHLAVSISPHEQPFHLSRRQPLTLLLSVLVLTPLALVWVVEVPSDAVDSVVTAAAGMVEVPALPHATNAVVRTTLLATVRRRP